MGPSCVHQKIKLKEQALRVSASDPVLGDDLDLKSLVQALESSVLYLNKNKSAKMTFGPYLISQGEYAASLEKIISKVAAIPRDKQEVYKYIQENFEFMEVYGQRKWGEVFITSYFLPEIQGSLKPTAQFSQPLYKTPPDLAYLKLSQFSGVSDKWNQFVNTFGGRSGDYKIPVRIQTRKGTKNKIQEIYPYYSRKEIDSDKVLQGKHLEWVWVDPVDAFFLQIQGSGTVVLKQGKMKIKLIYAAQNGRPYTPIGKFLFDKIPKEKINLQVLENFLHELSSEEQQELMNKNESYVFFQKINKVERAKTFIGSEILDGRMIATDYQFFPKGALTFLEFDKPVFNTPLSWEPTARFVVDHDTGGAIRGPGHIDLFWGRGSEAKKSSGYIKNWGRLYYLFPKASKEKVSPNGHL